MMDTTRKRNDNRDSDRSRQVIQASASCQKELMLWILLTWKGLLSKTGQQRLCDFHPSPNIAFVRTFNAASSLSFSIEHTRGHTSQPSSSILHVRISLEEYNRLLSKLSGHKQIAEELVDTMKARKYLYQLVKEQYMVENVIWGINGCESRMKYIKLYRSTRGEELRQNASHIERINISPSVTGEYAWSITNFFRENIFICTSVYSINVLVDQFIGTISCIMDPKLFTLRACSISWLDRQISAETTMQRLFNLNRKLIKPKLVRLWYSSKRNWIVITKWPARFSQHTSRSVFTRRLCVESSSLRQRIRWQTLYPRQCSRSCQIWWMSVSQTVP